ncbi:Metallo-hydrolase/oxidoreductase [Lentinus tigrinus ALCF2SS1-6]|uniref:Metallo-hydrolase/oxidoreductase n=1 Tax=Lentinus tigrinus ALCF2SS1-6 TaxID=1328759 RepID=A0A5C2S4K9_9APHY|nr:Metallo-hydrolase/oxidoreductase [Lentinus tigrinus ALCF2SS1-6]
MAAPEIKLTAQLTLDVADSRPPTKPEANAQAQVGPMPIPHEHKVHPTSPGGENATLTFIGTATTLFEWQGLRIMTDPNFLHAGDHVHLGPGVTAKRLTNPSVPLNQLPPIHLVLLSHYHEDHFDKLVEDRLRRDLPIITTPHAAHHLTAAQYKGEPFTALTALDTWEAADISAGDAKLRVTAMPGKHVAPGLTEMVNKALGAVPPTNGWMVELCGAGNTPYRIYISGDTLMVDKLRTIPRRFPHVDLMLVHLGGTTIPAPNIPLLMVTMDAEQGIQLVHLIKPDITIPIHYDDYDVFMSPLKDFQDLIKNAGLDQKVVYLNRGDQYLFKV